MAKKITRGITGIKDINKQDFDTNNVNDLLSDGQYNYIHRKKGKSEEYHNLTDNIKTISSDNTDLLTVTNNNKTNNTVTLHPKHDAQKEQVLESERNTVSILHGTNATTEKTKVDTNPAKVLEHDNLVSTSEYVTIEHDEHSEISKIKTDKLKNDMTELNNKIDSVERKIPKSVGGRNLAQGTSKEWSTPYTDFTGTENTTISLYKVITDGLSVGDTLKSRFVVKYTNIVPTSEKQANIWLQGYGNVTGWANGNYNTSTNKTLTGSGELIFEHEFKITANHLKNDYWILEFRTDNIASGSLQWKLAKFERGDFFTDWSPAPEDLNSLIAQKQNTLTSNVSIGVLGTGLRQLYTLKQTYTHTNGSLKTHVKSVSSNTSVATPEEEFNFILKINQGQQSATFNLNPHDKTKFSNIMATYGASNRVKINGVLFELSNSTLTVSTDANTSNNQVITFSDII